MPIVIIKTQNKGTIPSTVLNSQTKTQIRQIPLRKAGNPLFTDMSATDYY